MAQRSFKTRIAVKQHQLFDAGAMPSTCVTAGSDANAKTAQSQCVTVGIDNAGQTIQSQYVTVGIDEAGRGCLAGPVVAAAVVLPSHFSLPLLNDSKVLSAQQRATLAPQIKAIALSWSVGLSWPREIEQINILQATFHAMARAVHSLRVQPNTLLVDGNKRIPPLVLARFCKGEQPNQQAIVGGDALIPAISAASILAKTYRDHLMVFFHRRYPAYAFDAHKGYGTKAHMQALISHGPCPLHRLTFAGVLPPQQAPPKAQTQGQLC